MYLLISDTNIIYSPLDEYISIKIKHNEILIIYLYAKYISSFMNIPNTSRLTTHYKDPERKCKSHYGRYLEVLEASSWKEENWAILPAT
jgi:hypothetical protein